MILRLMPVLALVFAGTATFADAPKAIAAHATQSDGVWTIAVTIDHSDSGWDHYAKGWAVLAPDGSRIGYRELTHPHVDEMPFTRSLSGLKIPDDIAFVTIRPKCSLVGWAAEGVKLELVR